MKNGTTSHNDRADVVSRQSLPLPREQYGRSRTRHSLTACFFATGFMLVSSGAAEAGLGSLIWKSLSKVGRRSTSTVIRKGGARGANVAAKTAGRAGSGTAKVAGKIGQHVTSKAGRTVVSRLGAAGERALTKVSPRYASRLAELSGDLARNPYCDDWLAYIARAGDTALNVAWANKGSIAVLSVATAVALHPSEFVEAGERVATAAVESTTQHVAAPLAQSVASHAVAAFPWALFGNLSCLAIIGGGVLWYRRRR